MMKYRKMFQTGHTLVIFWYASANTPNPFQFIILVCEATDDSRSATCKTKMIGKPIFPRDEDYS